MRVCFRQVGRCTVDQSRFSAAPSARLCASVTRSDCCLRLAGGRLRKARNPRVLTPTTSHNRLAGKWPLCSSSEKRPTGAFPDPLQFKISLLSLRSRTSRRSRSFSLARSESSFETTSVSFGAINAIKGAASHRDTSSSSLRCCRKTKKHGKIALKEHVSPPLGPRLAV